MRITTLLLLFALLAVGACETTPDGELAYAEVEEQTPGEFEADADFHKQSAQSYYQAGDYRRALSQFRKWLEKQPDDPYARMGEAYCLYFIGAELAARGALVRADKLFDEAHAALEQLRSETDGEIEASTQTGEGLKWKIFMGLALVERARGALARTQFDALDARAAQVRDPKELEQLLAHQEELLRRRSDYSRKALERFRRLARMEYPAPEALHNLGDLELVLGNEDAAERAYLAYLNIAKRSVDAWDARRKKVAEMYESKHDLKVALDAIDRKQASALAKTVAVLERLAEIKYRRANYADAIGYLEQALELKPDLYRLHVPLAECYTELADYGKALEHIDVFIRSSEGFDDDTRKAYKLRSKLLREMKSDARQ